MTDFLDRAIGDLTLRELSQLAKAAQTMATAVADLSLAQLPVRIATPTIAEVRPPHRSRSTDEIRADRRKQDADAITSVRRQVDRESAARHEVGGIDNGHPKSNGNGPGSGRKVCKSCHEVSGARVRICICGQAFATPVLAQ